MKRIKGFTLLELLVVLSLIGIILSIGMVKLNFLENYNERLEVNTVINTLNYARNNSISTGERHTVYISSKNIRLDSSIEKKKIDLEYISIYNATSIEFASTGAPKEATTIELKGRKNYEITVEVATGKVNLKNENKIKGFTLIESLMGLAIVGIIGVFIIPSLISTINLENKNQEDKELLDYSKTIVESIKADIYNDKEVNVDNNIQESFDYYYNIEDIGYLRKLSVVVWRVGNEENLNEFQVLIP